MYYAHFSIYRLSLRLPHCKNTEEINIDLNMIIIFIEKKLNLYICETVNLLFYYNHPDNYHCSSYLEKQLS